MLTRLSDRSRRRRPGEAASPVCDVEHMTAAFPKDPQLNFPTDFAEDCAERRAAELLDRDKDEDEAA